jgi:hypothetical protein
MARCIERGSKRMRHLPMRLDERVRGITLGRQTLAATTSLHRDRNGMGSVLVTQGSNGRRQEARDGQVLFDDALKRVSPAVRCYACWASICPPPTTLMILPTSRRGTPTINRHFPKQSFDDSSPLEIVPQLL